MAWWQPPGVFAEASWHLLLAQGMGLQRRQATWLRHSHFHRAAYRLYCTHNDCHANSLVVAALHCQHALAPEQVCPLVHQQPLQPGLQLVHVTHAVPGDAHAADGAVVLVLLVLLQQQQQGGGTWVSWAHYLGTK